jgi:hypothetical protein
MRFGGNWPRNKKAPDGFRASGDFVDSAKGFAFYKKLMRRVVSLGRAKKIRSAVWRCGFLKIDPAIPTLALLVLRSAPGGCMVQGII